MMVSAPAAAQSTDFSLRIGTFNAWMLPGEGAGIMYPPHLCPGVLCCPLPESRGPFLFGGMWTCEVFHHPMYDDSEVMVGALALADRIRKSGYDVVAVNELWWGDAAEALTDALLPDYPFIVHTVGNPSFGTTPKTTSGLALFSKLPFQSVPLLYSLSSTYASYTQSVVFSNGTELPRANHPELLAFREFDESEHTDDHASKGVAYVRLRNPSTGRIHNVFWTHMQASYREDIEEDPFTWHGRQVRESQLQNMVDMLAVGEQTANGPATILRGREDIFYLGDFNIDGDISNFNLPFPPQLNNLNEWSTYFGANSTWNGGIFSQVLHDTWVHQHISADTFPPNQPTEFGTTAGCPSASSSGGCRIDYILHNTPALGEKLCNQHPHVAYNLDAGSPLRPGANPPGGRGNLSDGLAGEPSANFRSDHLGLVAHFNRLEPQCSPLLPGTAATVYGSSSFGARTLTNAELGNDSTGSKNYGSLPQLLTGTLHRPGSVQWWRVSAPGTYLIGFEDDGDPSSANTSFELGYDAMVFSASNLSSPIPSYRDDVFRGRVQSVLGLQRTIAGSKYVLDAPPYYIKVFHPVHDHRTVPLNGTGNYRFGVRRLGCMDKHDDACPIAPNTLSAYKFPATTVQSIPTSDSLYFTMHVEQLTVADAQNLELVVFGYSADHLQSAVVGTGLTTDPTISQGSDVLRNLGFDHRLAQEGITTGSTGYGGTCPSATGPMNVAALTRCNNRISWQHPQPSGVTAQRRVWRIRRASTAPASQLPFQLVWTTDLTAFYGKKLASGIEFAGMKLMCVEETSDGSPHDEIGMKMAVDGVAMLNGWVLDIADFQKGESKDVDSILAGFTQGRPPRFKSFLTLTLTEEDPGPTFQLAPLFIMPLARNVFGPSSAQTNPTAGWHLDDGLYTMPFLLSHGTQRFE